MLSFKLKEQRGKSPSFICFFVLKKAPPLPSTHETRATSKAEGGGVGWGRVQALTLQSAMFDVIVCVATFSSVAFPSLSLSG